MVVKSSLDYPQQHATHAGAGYAGHMFRPVYPGYYGFPGYAGYGYHHGYGHMRTISSRPDGRRRGRHSSRDFEVARNVRFERKEYPKPYPTAVTRPSRNSIMQKKLKLDENDTDKLTNLGMLATVA